MVGSHLDFGYELQWILLIKCFREIGNISLIGLVVIVSVSGFQILEGLQLSHNSLQLLIFNSFSSTLKCSPNMRINI